MAGAAATALVDALHGACGSSGVEAARASRAMARAAREPRAERVSGVDTDLSLRPTVGSVARMGGQWPWASRKRSASMAALQPIPAAVMAWRYTKSTTSPAAKAPSTLVLVVGSWTTT